MKISNQIKELVWKYDNKLKIIKKWIFWILLDEEAFFMSKYFNMKLTKLDKETIKVWFPDQNKDKWLDILENKGLWYVLFILQNWKLIEVKLVNWLHFWKKYQINIEDYNFTKDRILQLSKLWIEEKNEKNFLLKDKLEEVFILIVSILMRLPKKERYYLRSKIETLFLDILEKVYRYMYNLSERKELIKSIFSEVMIVREFCRFLYKDQKITNANVYANLWERFTEILKISKWIINTYD